MPVEKKELLFNIPLSQLTRNPKQDAVIHKNINSIKRSIVKVGYVNPIIVDENMMILAGHGRLQAMAELGIETATDVLKVTGLTQDEKDDYLIRDNKSAEGIEWNFAKLVEWYPELHLKDMGFDILRDKRKFEPEKYKMGFDVSAEMDYIVVFCEHKEDFVYLADKFGLEKVEYPKSRAIGVGRLVEAKKVVKLLSGVENELPS